MEIDSDGGGRGQKLAQTRARILDVAKTVFAEKGYPAANLREIAKEAGVAASLLIKHFGTKENLFDETLRAAIMDITTYQRDRSHFGAEMVAAFHRHDPQTISSRIIALSSGDPRAKEIVLRVTREHILTPMAAWLGGETAEARANLILMLTMGYAIFGDDMAVDTASSQEDTIRLLVDTIQGIVDGPPEGAP